MKIFILLTLVWLLSISCKTRDDNAEPKGHMQSMTKTIDIPEYCQTKTPSSSIEHIYLSYDPDKVLFS